MKQLGIKSIGKSVSTAMNQFQEEVFSSNTNSFDLWSVSGVWNIGFDSKLKQSKIVGNDFTYEGQTKNSTVGEGYGYLVNKQGAWKGYQSLSNSSQSGKLWFVNGDVYEGLLNNWKFSGQGKLFVALTGLSYEGVWDKNSLAAGKLSY